MKYVRSNAIMMYMEWANSKPFGMGKNTRNLFVGIKTLRGYTGRVAKLDAENAQSNGCLMRAWPLAFVEDKNFDPADDASITNPNEICCAAVRCYVLLLRSIVYETKLILPVDLPECVQQAIDDGLNDRERNISGENRGWVAHALYCAFLASHKYGSYMEGIDSIIRLGGDTDTNGAIAGAILGARFPLFARDEERAKKLVAQMLAVDTNTGGAPRPMLYHPREYITNEE
jgi:ADP-ribosylglycohydrolase